MHLLLNGCDRKRRKVRVLQGTVELCELVCFKPRPILLLDASPCTHLVVDGVRLLGGGTVATLDHAQRYAESCICLGKAGLIG